MTVVSGLKLYSVAIALMIWAGASFAGSHGPFVRGVFLTLVAVAAVVAETERYRLRRELRREMSE